jgi:uncharacterized Zn-binding protein involved in type VI secretion
VKLVVFVALALALLAAPSPEIRGVVLDPGTKQAVVDAEVTLEYYGPQQPRLMPSPPKSKATARTDSSGAFSFRPAEVGYFYIRVQKPGYSEAASQQSVTLTNTERVKEVRLTLARPGQISGRVVDEDTRKPVANVEVRALAMRRGRMLLPSGKPARSGADGEFVIGDLAPGDHLIQVVRSKPPAGRVLTRISEKDVDAVEQDFEETYWPGGHGIDAALPLPLPSGGALSVGVIPVRKVPYYRVRARFPGVNCGPGDKIGVGQFQRVQWSEQHLSIGEVPCKEELAVTGFAPGAYRLMFGLARAQGEPERASVPFVIVDKNAEVIASLERPVMIEGRFVAAEGSKLPDVSTAIVMWDQSGGKLTDMSGPAKPDAEGKFQLTSFLDESRRLMVYRLGAGGYVKEIRYNGIPVKGDLIPLNKGAVTQSLTIVVDDKPAAIAGQVVSDHKPVSQAAVIVAKWPTPDPDTFLPADFSFTKTDEAGKFQLGGLAPGEYRIVAVSPLRLAEDPPIEKVRQALAACRKIELRASGFESIELEVSDLR